MESNTLGDLAAQWQMEFKSVTTFLDNITAIGTNMRCLGALKQDRSENVE